MSPVSTKPRKKYKPRDTDPIKLIMARGLRQEAWTEEGEDGETNTFVKELPPQGVVLDGLQVQQVALTLARFQAQINILEAVIDDLTEDGEEEEEALGGVSEGEEE